MTANDADLAAVVNTYGPPPFWRRQPGFAALVLIILEQQVSLASARAVFERLKNVVSPFSAVQLLTTKEAVLKSAGLTRQKLAYCKALSTAVVDGSLVFSELNRMSDTETRERLMELKGIGPWTADIYLLMAMLRTDIWPQGDLALLIAMQEIKKLGHRPSNDEFNMIGESWRPWRAVAARILWHHYLSVRQRKAG